jgi:putative endonuclease
MSHQYYVYILSSTSGTLYTGVTNDLMRRVAQHKTKTGSAFTTKYTVNRLVYFEETTDVYKALDREKEIKGWRRSKKLALIREFNPTWRDLSEDW